jgi:hypothetical protein
MGSNILTYENSSDQLLEIEGTIRDMIARTKKGSEKSLKLHREIGQQLLTAKILLPRKYSQWVKSKFAFRMVWASRLTKLASNWDVIEPLLSKWTGDTYSVEEACRIIKEQARNPEEKSPETSPKVTKSKQLQKENIWLSDQVEMFRSRLIAIERQIAEEKLGEARAPVWIFDSECGWMCSV